MQPSLGGSIKCCTGLTMSICPSVKCFRLTRNRTAVENLKFGGNITLDASKWGKNLSLKSATHLRYYASDQLIRAFNLVVRCYSV